MLSPRATDGGVPAWKLRAALSLARVRGDGDGVTWSAAEWERVFKHLTPQQQHVLYHHLLRGLTHAEVAEELGITRSSVSAAFARAVERIADVVPHG